MSQFSAIMLRVLSNVKVKGHSVLCFIPHANVNHASYYNYGMRKMALLIGNYGVMKLQMKKQWSYFGLWKCSYTTEEKQYSI